MRNRHKATLRVVFTDPVSASVLWADIEKLLLALGAEISEGQGSRVRVYLGGVRAVFHRPHPEKEAAKGAVRAVRRFLHTAGITPTKEG